ncbi:MAG: NAD-dependent epimerase/dehydratase family protein [Clostridium sp.]
MDKKITIIGANSYIARNLIEKCKIRQIKNLKLYDIDDKQFDGNKNYKKINMMNIESIENIDFDSDIIFIFTGKTGTIQGFNDYSNYIDINEKILLNILYVYIKKKSKAKIIFPSTRLVYKGKHNTPLKEDDDKEFKTIYAINKFCCEQYLKIYNNVYGINYCIFRICVPYGTIISEASSYGTAEFFIDKAKNGEDITVYGDGTLKRTFIYIGDLCNALIDGAMSESCLNDIYNIGGETMSLCEMATKIANAYNVNVKFTKWPEEALKVESGDTIFDSSKFDFLMNFQYKQKFDGWIKNSIL